jgi:hypothetical protein
MNNEFTFTVEPHSIVLLTVQGFVDEDKLLVEIQTTPADCVTGEPATWVPFSPGGCQWFITINYNPKQFDTPGVYRLVFEGAPNTDENFGIIKTILT